MVCNIPNISFVFLHSEPFNFALLDLVGQISTSNQLVRSRYLTPVLTMARG